MPQKIDERTQTHTQDFINVAQSLDSAAIVPLFDGNGKEVNVVRGVFNPGVGEVIAAVGGRYAIVPHEQVYLTAMQRLEAAGLVPSRVEVFQSPSRFTCNIVFGNAKNVRNDPDRQVDDLVEFGFRFVNTYDGTTPVRGGLFASRLRCKNGMVGPMTEVMSVKRKHTVAAIADLDAAMGSFIDNGIAQIEAWKTQMTAATLEAITPKNAEALVKSLKFGPRIEKKILARLPEYVAEMGETRWAVVNAATHVVSHDIEVSQASVERHQSKAMALLTAPVPVAQ